MRNGPQISTNGLVLSLDAADRNSYAGTGTILRDLSGNGNDGILTNGPTFSIENSGRISFDGIDDHIAVSNNANLNFGTGDFTVLTWVSGITSYPGSAKTIIWKGSQFDSNQAGWSIVWASSPLDLYFIISSGLARLEGRATPNGSLNGWTGYKMIGMQRSSGTWNQIDNTSITNLGSFTGNVDNAQPLYIARNGIYNSYLSNVVSCVMIYNRAITAAEVLQNFNAMRGRFGT